MTKLLGCLLAVLLVAGCAHVPPPVAKSGCVIPAYPLTFSNQTGVLAGNQPPAVVLPAPPGAPGAAAEPRTFGDAIAQTLNAVPPGEAPPPGAVPPSGPPLGTRDVLVLSGGSLHGAFGAGFLYGLKSQGKVPDYRIVTAVSTGALQATLAFLANQKEPSDRIYKPYMWAASGIGRPKESNLGDLDQAYAIEKESNLMKVNSLGYLGAALNGSIATFSPLKGMIEGLISVDTLNEVAAEAAKGRRLFIGVANLDDGNGYALDLTSMVLKASMTNPKGVSGVRDCYIDALIASASVPPGVPLVTLNVDTHPNAQEPHPAEHYMFMDGGARFGVFFQQVHDASSRLSATGAAPVPANIALIVNGPLYGDPWLDGHGNKLVRWSVVNFGLRAVDLLQNQVYRFSVDEMEKWAPANGTLTMAFISNEQLSPTPLSDTEEPDQHRFRNSAGVSDTCGRFRSSDKQAMHPQEFEPNYMQCMISYGRQRGAGAHPWNLIISQNVAGR